MIRSDSQAAVLALQSSFIHSSIVEECLTTLNRLSEKNKVILQWIKAHVGHVGNEAADLYAKLGSELGQACYAGSVKNNISCHEPNLPYLSIWPIKSFINESFIFTTAIV